MAKIKSVETKLIGRSFGIPDFGAHNEYLLIKISDIDGNFGLGYIPEIFDITGDESFGKVFEQFVSTVIAPLIIGKDADFIEEIWEELFQKTTRWGRRGFILASIGAVDIALWDLMGKTSGKPFYRLIGGYRKEVPTYANTAHDLSPNELALKAKEYVNMGFDTVKIRGSLTAVSPEIATERIKKVREEVGDNIKILVDLNGTYKLDLAIRTLKRWEKYNLFWVEEPVHPNNIESFKRLKREINIPIATGEQHGTIEDFKLLLESEAVDIIQPDPVYVGGVTEWLNVSAMAKAYGVPVSPHLNQIVSAHLVASRNNTMWIEYTPPDNPLGQVMFYIFEGPSSIMMAKNGKVYVSDDPGFGFKLRKEIRF